MSFRGRAAAGSVGGGLTGAWDVAAPLCGCVLVDERCAGFIGRYRVWCVRASTSLLVVCRGRGRGARAIASVGSARKFDRDVTSSAMPLLKCSRRLALARTATVALRFAVCRDIYMYIRAVYYDWQSLSSSFGLRENLGLGWKVRTTDNFLSSGCLNRVSAIFPALRYGIVEIRAWCTGLL